MYRNITYWYVQPEWVEFEVYKEMLEYRDSFVEELIDSYLSFWLFQRGLE